jgi:pyruvate dehydrogenase E1 component beta subunit
LYGKSFEVPDEPINPIPLDRAIIMRYGTDVTIVAFSISVEHALNAADILQERYGISAEVINLVSLRPIDKETIIESVKKTGRIITVEEGWPACGIGSEITSLVVENAFDYLDAEPRRVTSANVPMPYSSSLEKGPEHCVSEIVSILRH